MNPANTTSVSPVAGSKPGARLRRPMWRHLPLALMLAAALTGCQRTAGFFGSSGSGSQQTASSLEPAPLPPVRESQLEPVQQGSQQSPQGFPDDAGTVDVASASPPPAGETPLSRQAMIGAWTVSTGGSSCQIFLALTKWSGGYRAASRGCSAPSIADVQAWDVKGSRVVLVNASGGTAASLSRSSDQRYNGSTTSGESITFTR